MSTLKLPREYRPRLDTAAKKHGFTSGEAFANHLIDKGLATYEAEGATQAAKLAFVTDANGYSSEAELVEHLLERGLRAYEDPADDPAKLEARLRGLGYIE
jgi:hypothetical protein